MSVMFLKRAGKPALAYQALDGKPQSAPAIVFLSGFASDMTGTKAAYLSERCEARGQGFIRFDYSGHGQSEGDFADGTIGSWKDDALAVIDELTQGDIILVGSSMGGWIGLLCALARKERVKGFIGIAAAPDFTRSIPSKLHAQQKQMLEETGFFPLPSSYGENPYVITSKLLADGENHCLLGGPIEVDCPVRLLQGKLDPDVPWQTAQKIADAITGSDKKVILRENGDHRLSTSEDLAIIDDMVVELSEKT